MLLQHLRRTEKQSDRLREILILPSIALIREKEARDHITRQIPFPLASPPATESASKCPRSSLLGSPRWKIVPQSRQQVCFSSEREMGGGVRRRLVKVRQSREREKWPHPSVRPFVCLADQFGGNREWVRRRRHRPLPLRLLLGFVLVVFRRRETMRTTTTTLKNEKYFPNGLASERQRGRRAE